MRSPERWRRPGPEPSRDKASPPASACCCGTEEEQPVKQAAAARQTAAGIFKTPPFVRLFSNQLSYNPSLFASMQLPVVKKKKKKSLFCLIERFCAWFNRCRRCLVWPYHKLPQQPYSCPTPPPEQGPSQPDCMGSRDPGMKRLPGKQGNCLGFKRVPFLCGTKGRPTVSPGSLDNKPRRVVCPRFCPFVRGRYCLTSPAQFMSRNLRQPICCPTEI